MRLELNLPDLPDVPPGWLAPAAWAAGGLGAYLLAGAVTAGLCYRWRRHPEMCWRSPGGSWGDGQDVANACIWPLVVLTAAPDWLLPILRVLLYVPARPFVWVARLAAGRE